MVMYILNKNSLHLKRCVIYKSVLDDSFFISSSSNKTSAFTFMSHLLHNAI